MTSNNGRSEWDHYETYILVAIVGVIVWVAGGIWAEVGSTAELVTQLCGVVAFISGPTGVWVLGKERGWWA